MLRRYFVTTILTVLLTAPAVLARAENNVIFAKIDGAIMPPTTTYLRRAIERAEREKAECLLIEMNTPGGVLSSTRDISGLFLTSSVPIVIYVTPSGARAGSAGALICLGANVVAMAPGTNIGAAHPVGESGADIEKDMRDKVTNDAAALARSLAEKRGRDRKWAEDIVRHSTSSTETEAVKLKIADFVAQDRADLFRQLDGKTLKTAAGSRTLHTAGATVSEENETLGETFLGFLYNPNVALLLFMMAVYGVVAEVNHPGAIFPGVVGAICLVLALFTMSVLSVNATGAILLMVAVALFIIDLYATTHGVLTVGGLIAFVVGGLLLFNPGALGVSISIPFVLTLAIMTGLFFGVLMTAALRSRSLPPGTGPETLIGMTGEAKTDLNPRGRVFVDGALWDAENVDADPIHRGDKVIVQALTGLTLKVKRAEPQSGEPIWSKTETKTEEETE